MQNNNYNNLYRGHNQAFSFENTRRAKNDLRRNM